MKRRAKKAGQTQLNVINNWKLGKKLGCGSYAEVRLAHNLRQPSQKAAVKIINLAALCKTTGRDKDQVTMHVLREIASMEELQHNNVVELYDVAFREDSVFMIMQYAAGGDMFDLVKDAGALDEVDARFYFRQLVSAVEYCHCHFIVHRDLKLENLLLSESKATVMLADFGLSNRLVAGRPLETTCGSSQYAAPEVLCGSSYLGPASDVWSLGVVLYAFVMGSLPFAECGNSFNAIAKRAMQQDFDLDPYLSEDCKDLLLRLLDPNADTRFTVQQIRVHPWVNRGYSSPPECLLPRYPVVNGRPDADVVAKLTYFGFKPLELVHTLKTCQHPCAELAMYHHLLEKKKLRRQRVLSTDDAMGNIKALTTLRNAEDILQLPGPASQEGKHKLSGSWFRSSHAGSASSSPKPTRHSTKSWSNKLKDLKHSLLHPRHPLPQHPHPPTTPSS